MPARSLLIGRTFERLFVFNSAPSTRQPNGHALRRSWVRCKCGKEFIVLNVSLLKGNTRSCGCLARELASLRIVHGLSRTKIYDVWIAMKQRCDNPNSPQFKDYGGRGIGYIPEWSRFETFFEFMGPGKKGWSIHRVDNDAGYFPENMVWATSKFQQRHTRRNRIFTVFGKTACVSELAEMFGIHKGTIASRLRAGWSIEKALTCPVKSNRLA